jgi:hypothetical protein
MSLTERLAEHVRACFAGIWIESHEHEEALREVASLCRTEGWRLATWDINRGLNVASEAVNESAGGDPLAAVRALPTLASAEAPALLLAFNFHRYLGSPEIVQAVAQAVAVGKQTRTFLVVVSPVVQLPVELEKLFVVLEHPLPDREQLAEIARGVATEPGELPEGNDLGAVLDAAAGLTRYEAENSFALAIVRGGQIEPQPVWSLKAQALKKAGLLSLHRGTETFADLGGLDAVKQFCTRVMRKQGSRNVDLRPKGALLLGIPGSGKSLLAKALGNETGRPTIVLDLGNLLGSLVGSTEQNVRKALRQIDQMAPCVVFVDELEKALSGVAGGPAGDSGVSARMFGTLLTWLSDRESDVFVIATANDVSRLPPELTRAERSDAIFFLDLPGREQKDIVWRMYREQFSIPTDQPRPDDEDWTPAEIRSCCRLAALLDLTLTEAATHVVPVAHTAHESIEGLRQWASGRCLSAETGHVYRYQATGDAKPQRQVIRPEPSDN